MNYPSSSHTPFCQYILHIDKPGVLNGGLLLERLHMYFNIYNVRLFGGGYQRLASNHQRCEYPTSQSGKVFEFVCIFPRGSIDKVIKNLVPPCAPTGIRPYFEPDY